MNLNAATPRTLIWSLEKTAGLSATHRPISHTKTSSCCSGCAAKITDIKREMQRRGTSTWSCGQAGPVKTATVPFTAPTIAVNRQIQRTQVARMRTMKNPTTASMPAIRPPKPALPRLGARPAMGGAALASKMKTASINTRKMLGQMTSMQSLSEHAMMRARDVKNGSLPTKFKVPLVKAATAGDVQPCVEGGGRNVDRRLMARVMDIQKRMRPGDIVTTDPRQPVFHRKIFKALSKQVQKSRFGHSAMYVGNGDVVESRDVTVVKRPLLDVARCNDFVVHRVNVNAAHGRDAAAWVKKNVGNDKLRVTVRSLLRRGALPTSMAGSHEGNRVKKMDQAICSSLIANAYPKVPFNPQRAIMNTRPNDIINSDNVRLVGKIAGVTPKQELRRRVGACADGVSLKQDNKGWYVATHRCRSASYPSVDDIPTAKVRFVASTS